MRFIVTPLLFILALLSGCGWTGPKSKVKEIGDRYWVVDLYSKEGWVNTNIPVTANQHLLIYVETTSSLWAARISNNRYYNREPNSEKFMKELNVWTTEKPSLENEQVGLAGLSAGYQETLFLKLDEANATEIRLYVKTEFLPCPFPVLLGHPELHQEPLKWATDKMAEIANH